MLESANATNGKPRKWYSNARFPLVPEFTKSEGDQYNTTNYSFKWMFFTFWTLNHVYIELSIVASDHWGFGIIGILPYLRWAITVPFPRKVEEWAYKYLYRTPKPIKE